MDWNDLRYFLSIARSGSLAKAARELSVEHTTVSRRLGALEEDLGTRLFARGPSGLVLTTAGKNMLPLVQDIAEQISSIERCVTGLDGRVAGNVRLTIPESGNGYFTHRLRELRSRHPELVIELISDNRPLDIRRGEADIAVRFAAIPDQDLVVRKPGKAGWSLYASPSYLARKGPLVSVDDVTGHELIGYADLLAMVEGEQWLRSLKPPPVVVMRGNSIMGVARAAVEGIGIAPLPCFAAAQEAGLLRLTPEIIGERDIMLVVHPDLVRVARVRATMDFLIELLHREAALWSGRNAPDPG
jgi:DNA-binding transcriptional LysR family regulator